jgi:flagellar motor switch/type III secretory pathway protein FliN
VSIEVVEKSAKSNLSFNNAFAWYKDTLEEALKSSVRNFLEDDFDFKLVSVSKTPNIITKNDSYFVTQVKLHDDVASSLKLSQNSIDMILEVALGKSEYGFEIEYLTELEAKVLTAFNHDLYKGLSKIFIPNNKIKTLINENELKAEYIYFTFLTQDKHKTPGKIIATLPCQILAEPDVITPTPESLPEVYFNRCPIEVDLYVGKTKILLEDVKMLQEEDIVILEKSDISSMSLVGDFEFKFNVNPDPMLVYNYQDNSEYEISEDEMTNTKQKNRWDLIQVDMSAEFEKIKMPLGELRQISKGLIVDLADVYKNEITLKVENNAIAKGELVIIDDKYGVLIKEIFTEESKETSAAAVSSEVAQSAPAASGESSDDDFDLEDFDIDDEDLDEDFDDDFDDEDI